jgi:surface polysaccharide O-acyltransferase-like enzyme
VGSTPTKTRIRITINIIPMFFLLSGYLIMKGVIANGLPITEGASEVLIHTLITGD